MKTFKSERAARAAYTKAENDWKKVRELATDLTWERRRKMQEQGGSMDSEEYREYDRRIAQAEEETRVRYAAAKAVYAAATAQGIFVKSYHFGHNPTRDLIAQNID